MMGQSSTKIVAYRPFLTPAVRALLCLLPLAGLCALTACNPASLAYLITPFVDDKEQPKCKIAEKNKEVTLAIVTWFGSREMHMYPETMPADSELSERLATNLRQRYTANKDKVKIVPYAQVRNYQNKQFGDTWSPADVGKLVKADKVIALEINALSLYEKGSLRSQALFHGNLDVAVKVYDLAKPAEDQVVFSDFYKHEFPKGSPINPDMGAAQFRGQFIEHAARDLGCWFATYTNDERMYKMDMTE
jgi:hypothetical protein